MSVDASIPKALYQANVGLALRLATLLQENGAQWFDLFAAEANERLTEARAQRDANREAQAESGRVLPSPEQMLRWMHSHPSRWQGLLTQAVGHQLRFIEGVQSALQQWQSECAEAFGNVAPGLWGAGMSPGLMSMGGVREMAASMQDFIARFVPSVEGVSTQASSARAAPTAAAPQKAKARTSASTPATAKSSKPAKPAKPAAKVGTKVPVKTKESPRKPRPTVAAVTRSRRSKAP
ncbi:MAG TPA: hypothetical protein VFN29_04495 [Chiayiivirga sp.]|nr:hypothetical protein [Chiayiivirga sp.]